MTITFLFDKRALINKTEDYVNENLAKKITENGFEISAFYSPENFQSNNINYTKFKFDLSIAEKEKELVDRITKEWIDDIQIPKPRTEYSIIIDTKERECANLVTKEISNVVEINKATGRLNQSNNRIYLDIYNYSQFKKLENKLIQKKDDLGINNIKLTNTRRLIGKIEKTKINDSDVNLFLQNKDYEKVILDLKEFVSGICELLSASQLQTMGNQDSTNKEKSYNVDDVSKTVEDTDQEMIVSENTSEETTNSQDDQ